MSRPADNAGLLASLAPKTAERPQFGIAVAALLAKGAALGLKFIRSPEGKKYLARMGKTREQAQRRYDRYRRKYEAETDPSAKARWKRRMDRSKAILDDWVLRDELAKRGIVGKGPVLEYKRNLLAAQWSEANAERRKEIEASVAKMDAELAEIKAKDEKKAEKADQKQTAAVGLDKRRFRGGSLSRRIDITRARRSGMGGMRFDVLSPPGPGRLVRIPFYPVNNADSWVGANGIDFPGDDPVLNLVIPQGQTWARPLMMETEQFDYGSYRILGLQTNEQWTYKTIGDAVAGPQIPFMADVAITLSQFSLYNGAELFLPDPVGEMHSRTYNIHPADVRAIYDDVGVMGIPPLCRAELPYNYLRRRNRWFGGLRDQPVVSGTTRVQIVVSAFARFYSANPPPPTPVVGGLPAVVARARATANDLEIPFTCNVIAEMVEDTVFGDVVNPSPAGRQGAQLKLGAREIGTTMEGRDVLEITSSRYRKPR